MGELLLTELAICAAVIAVAAVVLVVLRLRGSNQPRMPAAERHGTVAELFGERMPEREVADRPGSSQDTMERDPGASVPAGPEQAAETPAGSMADADLGSTGIDAEPQDAPAATGATTLSERVDGYYQDAEQSMADYLAAHGWTEEQGKPGRVAGADAAPAPAEAAAEPTVHRHLAA
jgi:hypothetical protein